ncbi:excinuclease ABC subunit UvrA [Puniceicoccaceae bacterium K14]|nr:excinuclease ABC subunit UvrA [Puniceicoccaceae bacterium K14]
MSLSEYIHIKGAREHNLQNVEVRIPRDRLVVVTGVSGSGKSSLAFDTLYAEGYRKYMESLSTQARQAMEQIKRPDVDFIHGLSPVLAIEQRAGSASPRSTVATVTEIADYARLLWVMEGEQRCPKDGGTIAQQTLESSIERILALPERTRIVLLAPYMTAKPAVIREELPRLRQKGYQRIRLGGEIVDLDDPDLAVKGRSDVIVEIVVDRLVVSEKQRSRIADSLELAFVEGKDRVIALTQVPGESDWGELSLSRNFSCGKCGEVYEPITPRHFSFNTKEGACPECSGIGKTRRFLEELVIPDPSKSVKGGALKPLRIGGKSLIIRHNALLKQLAEQLPYDQTCPWKDLAEETRQEILYGTGERLFEFKLTRGRRKKAIDPVPYPGVMSILHKAYMETSSDGYRARLMAYQTDQECALCNGSRFSPRSSNVLVNTKSLPDLLAMDVNAAWEFLNDLVGKKSEISSYGEVVEGIEQRLRFLKEVGLDYLTLDRRYNTLSGGESQRVRLATQLGMSLMGVVYVLDEPSIGLHPKDNQRLIKTLQGLRDAGNSVVVVEHDEDTMRAADYLIELGPGAGHQGGHLMFQGTFEQCRLASGEDGSTSAYLSGKRRIEKVAKDKVPEGHWIEIKEASHHNLKNISVSIPEGLFTCVTGVSGSGKSTLINHILAKAAARKLNRSKDIPGKHKGVEGLDRFERAVRVSQEPIGQSPRSNPATYTKVFDLLRNLYSKIPLSRVRGYKAGRFSFNVKGGRCERCKGDGVIKLDMLFMSDAYVECPSCLGKRYNRETLEVRYSGKTIAETLDMSVDEALELFKNVPRLFDKLNTLKKVGLGYLKLGQPANTLSGGEAQRLKLSLELSKKSEGRALYILDEPTTGLHWADVQNLLDLLFQLRDQGNTIVVIEHDLGFINLADWVIDLGPGGGSRGGQLLYSGTTEGLRKCDASETGKALQRYVEMREFAVV